MRYRVGVPYGLVIAVALAGAWSCQKAPSPLPTLRRIDEINQLSLADAGRGYPVEIEGFVPFHGPQGQDTFVCEKEVCIAIDAVKSKMSLAHDAQKLEPLVRVHGRTIADNRQRAIAAVEIEVTGQIDVTQDEVPAPRLAEVWDGTKEALFVSAKGQVRGFHTFNGRALFTFVTDSRHVPTVLEPGLCGDYPPVSDGEVRLTGVAVAVRDSSGNPAGARLLASPCNALRIIRDGPQDLFEGEAQTTADASSSIGRRILLRGTLHRSPAAPPQYSVEDGHGTMTFLPVELPTAQEGDAVVVTGYPETHGSAVVLSDALVRTQPLPTRPTSTARLPTLTTVTQVRHLSAEEAGRGYPVHLHAVVTYTYSQMSQFFVQDSTGGIYVEAWRHLWEIPAGRLVEIVGKSGPGLFAPIIEPSRVTVLGAAPMPTPEKVSFDDLMTGSHDSQWVEVEGLVRRVRAVGHTVQIEMVGIGLSGRLPVTIPNLGGSAPTHLVDSRVRIRGVCATNFNDQRQPINVRVQSPDLSAVTVVEAAASDPFSMPATSIADLLRFDSDRGLQRRVRVHGVVTLHVPGQFVYIQDGNHGVMVTTEQELSLSPGDVIDAVGFPGAGRAAPEVQDSVIRVSGRAAPPAVRSLTPEQIFNGNGDSMLVTMQGRVVNAISTAGEQILTIRDRSFLISAHLHQAGPVPETWPAMDALVEVTGVCSVQEVSAPTILGLGRPQAFRLLLRSNSDIRLIEAPPWWTRGRVITALILLSGVLVASWLWLAALQRTLRRQTMMMQARLAREAALEERYRKLFESANDIVFTLDLDGRITSLNRAGRELFSFSTDLPPDCNLIGLVVPEHQETAREIFNRELPEGAVTVYEINAYAHDGKVRTLEVSSRPVVEEGRVVGFEGIARDATERTQAEQMILAFTAKLEQSNAELQSFADVASHDLQEPLRKVRAFADKLGAKWESLSRDEITDILRRMQSAAERMQALISQLLAYARLGNVKPQMLPVDLSALARDVVDDLGARIEQTGGRVEVGPLPRVKGDATQLRQLVQNLVGNALKFGIPGQAPTVRVYTTLESSVDGGFCEIAVQDNGIGFEQKDADRVFQAFYRLHTRQEYEGTGLGLAISHRIVQRHGGTIRATSAPGAGTTFYFTLATASISSPTATGA
jgi:PAS domain S-box-containing protein